MYFPKLTFDWLIKFGSLDSSMRLRVLMNILDGMILNISGMELPWYFVLFLISMSMVTVQHPLLNPFHSFSIDFLRGEKACFERWQAIKTPAYRADTPSRSGQIDDSRHGTVKSEDNYIPPGNIIPGISVEMMTSPDRE